MKSHLWIVWRIRRGRRPGLPGLCHESINELVEHASVADLAGSLRNLLADGRRVTGAEVARLIAAAADLAALGASSRPLPSRRADINVM